MDLNQQIFKYGIYYPVVCFRGEHVYRHLALLNQTQWCSKEEIVALQTRKLRDLVSYAKREIPYYHANLSSIEPSDILRITDLAALPVLEKDTIRQHISDLLRKDNFKRVTRKTTSGSTGRIVTVWKDANAMGQELAAAWRGYSWAGVDIGDKQGRFWGVPSPAKEKFRARVIDFVTHRKRCSAFSFDDESMQRYTELLNSFQAKYLYGYVSMLVQYARYLKDAGRRLSSPLKCVITTAEVLTDSVRDFLEGSFSCPVFNEYGCGEVGTIAHQCEKGSLHVNAENLIVEILREGQPCRAGELGEITVTELNNRTMPLVRYKLGDVGAFKDQRCPCGRGLPVIDKIVGRAYDIIYNRSGKSFHGEFFLYIFEDANRRNLGVKGFQVIQKDLETLNIKIVPDLAYSANTEKFIKERIRSSFDPDVKLEFEAVSDVKREPSGKMRLVVGMPRDVVAG